jgi:membrane-associated protease RseP (regulator of RpoE activity)
MGSGITIENVEPGSIAAELEIEAGDRLLAINGS